MRILQLTKKFPHPLRDGEAWAVQTLAMALHKTGFTIDLYTLHDSDASEELWRTNDLGKQNIYNNIFSFRINTAPGVLSGMLNLVGSTSYHAARFNKQSVYKDLKNRVNLSEYDILLVESVYMMHYAEMIRSINSGIKCLLRTHNVEHLIWKRYANGLSGFKKKYLVNQSKRLRKFESEQINKADGLLVMSHTDLTHLENECELQTPALVTPIGMSKTDISYTKRDDKPLVLGFIGSLDWRPNIEGMEWFFENVWRFIQDSSFDSVLMIAGKNAKRYKLWQNVPGVNFMGEIEDSNLFMERIDLLVVPLLSGSGTRVKILQAFATNTPVLTTSIGAEGLDIAHEKECFILDQPTDWEDAINTFEGEHQVGAKLASAASRYLEANHDPVRIAEKVVSFIQGL